MSKNVVGIADELKTVAGFWDKLGRTRLVLPKKIPFEDKIVSSLLNKKAVLVV